MKKPHMPKIRELLRQHPDGLTTTDIAARVPGVATARTARKALTAMPDAYIDRWAKKPNTRGQFMAVWCVVTPPPHCPYPTERFNIPQHGKITTRWATVY